MWKKNSHVSYREVEKKTNVLRRLDALLVITMSKKKEFDGFCVWIIWKGVKEEHRKFTLEKHKVALVIDNCTTHLNNQNLNLITLHFPTLNATLCLHPMDQGVIQWLECKYCSRITQKIIRTIENGKQIPSTIIINSLHYSLHYY